MTLTADLLRSSVANRGNVDRLSRFLTRAARGESLTLACIGGSITQGFSASSPEKSWVSLTGAWFTRRFPLSRFTLINAGIGATTSLVGVHRLEEDVLSRGPDLLAVDFAVNDPAETRFAEAFESLLRETLSASPDTAVIALFMARREGMSARELQLRACERLGVSALGFDSALEALLRSGQARWEDLEADEVHPNDRGHELVSSLLTGFLETLSVESFPSPPSVRQLLPPPLYGALYGGGRIYSAQELVPEALEGFLPFPGGFQRFQNGWILEGGRGFLRFRLRARSVHLLYRRSVRADAGSFRVLLPGRDTPPLSADTAFPGGWGDYAETLEVYRPGPEGPSPAEEEVVFEVEAYGPVTVLGILVAFRDAGEGARP